MNVKSAGEKSKVLLADDHPIVRQGLVKLINQQDDMTVCAEADSPHKALEMVAAHTPDIAVVDLSYGGLDGIELVKDIKARWPALPVLVLSMHDETFYADRVLRAGAMGYIMKQEPISQVLEAIRRLLAGEIWLSQRMCAKLLNIVFERGERTGGSPMESLSDRELEVFELLGQGLTTRQIAKNLHLSVKTIESHRAHIKSKLKLKNATELVQHAIRWVEQSQSAAH